MSLVGENHCRRHILVRVGMSLGEVTFHYGSCPSGRLGDTDSRPVYLEVT